MLLSLMVNLYKDILLLVKQTLIKKYYIDKREVKVSKDGYFAFGIGKDRKYDVVITEKR